jgi:putative transposase
MMQEEQRRAAKGHMIALMQVGHPWQEAATMAGVRIGRSAAYQLLRNVRTHGEIALYDGRHGHPVKVRAPMLQWLESTYGKTPHTPSRMVQAALHERFGITVSIGHLNRIRAKWGGGSRTVPRGKKLRVRIRQENPTGKKGRVVSSC